MLGAWAGAGFAGLVLCRIMVVMGSQIEAVIYGGAELPPRLPSGLRVVSLPGGLTMLPVADDLADRLDQARGGDDRICPGWLLRQPVAALARQISQDRKVLYIVGETFGGAGTQEAIGWQEGRLMYGPLGTCDVETDLEPGYRLVPPSDSAINAGLRFLGVHASSGQDEYETIGLTRHGYSEDWIRG